MKPLEQIVAVMIGAEGCGAETEVCRGATTLGVRCSCVVEVSCFVSVKIDTFCQCDLTWLSALFVSVDTAGGVGVGRSLMLYRIERPCPLPLILKQTQFTSIRRLKIPHLLVIPILLTVLIPQPPTA